MLRTSFLFVCGTALLAHAAQPGRLMSGSGTLSNGVRVVYMMMAEPPLGQSHTLKIGSSGTDGDSRGWFRRSFVDRSSNALFGYVLMAVPEDANRFRVTIEPLSLAPEDGTSTLAPLPKYPPPQTVQAGDTIALDLFVSADGRQKLVDYIQVSLEKEPPAPSSTGPEPKDYTIDDGPVALPMEGQWRVFVNGQQWAGIAGLTRKPGSTIWFSFPNKGRYILSLVPRDGFDFQKTGSIRDNTILFQSGSDRYEIRLPGPIVGAGGSYNLYVLHDPAYQPKPVASDGVHGGIDRLENLLKR
jgi:hypothetical protein